MLAGALKVRSFLIAKYTTTVHKLFLLLHLHRTNTERSVNRKKDIFILLS